MPARARRLKVLLAEDDPVTADVVVNGLGSDPGLEVVHVADGAAALAALEEGRFAAAILDIKLPVYDGLYVLLAARENPALADLPIVLLTALGSEADVIRGFELGADDYIPKPFSARELTLRLQRLLGRRPSRASRLSQGDATKDTGAPAERDPEVFFLNFDEDPELRGDAPPAGEPAPRAAASDAAGSEADPDLPELEDLPGESGDEFDLPHLPPLEHD